MTQIGSVYAEALYDLARGEGLSRDVLDEMRALQKIFSENAGFIRILAAPGLPKQERIAILDESLRGKIQPYVLNFLKILTERGYIRHFSDCCEAYRNLYNEDNGILPVKAATAVPLEKEQAARLTEKLEKLTGKRIELENTVDPSCIGGVRLDYDGKRVDGTVRHHLDAVRGLLKNTTL